MKKKQKISEAVEYEKDIYWRQFLNLMKVAEHTGHLEENYPTEKGLMTAASRTENEIFFIELIERGLLSDLSHAELAALLCAVVTEEVMTTETYQNTESAKKSGKHFTKQTSLEERF